MTTPTLPIENYIDLSMMTLAPHFCYLVKDSEDLEFAKVRVRRVRKGYPDTPCTVARVNNYWSCTPERVAEYCKMFKEQMGYDHPCPHLIKPLDAKIVVIVLLDGVDLPFRVSESFEIVPHEYKGKPGGFTYKKMFLLEMLRHSIDMGSMTLLDPRFVRCCEKDCVSREYAPGSMALQNVQLKKGDFEFALEDPSLRERMINEAIRNAGKTYQGVLPLRKEQTEQKIEVV